MKHYLHFSKSNTHYSLSHDFTSVFKRIEFPFFCFLCLVFIVTSKINKDFSRSVSGSFIGISMPITKFAALPFNTAINLLTNFQELIEAKKNNEVLKAENEKLKSFYINAVNIGRENKELKQTLQFITTKSSSYKVGHIIGRTHQIFNQAVYIDIGKNRDVKEGSIVSGNRGVIGRISEVFDDKSRLLLVTDANSRIPIITSKARVRGILAGNNSSTMEILYLQKNHAIRPGDFVFTSGDGDTLPAGILIGIVKRVDKGYAAVEMVENINNADIITVMDY
ncbi:MAG: rod shape-determining protein MreC [Rickettsiales bacterium]|nr:rod shape-determining protein MreC [Rickettsiales bacterium]